MITRILLLLLAILILIWLIKKQYTPPHDVGLRANNKIGDLAACFYCKVHVLKTLGIERHGTFFCSKAHAALHEAEQKK